MYLEKQLFNSVFNNIVIQKPIFQYVKWIHQKIQKDSYKWENFSKIPRLLVDYGYHNPLQSYLENYEFPLSVKEYFIGILISIRKNSPQTLSILLSQYKIMFEVFPTIPNMLDVIDQYTKSDYKEALELVGQYGGVECLEWLVKKINNNQDSVYSVVANLSVYFGQTEITKWLLQNIPECTKGSIFYLAVTGGKKSSLKWIHPALSLKEDASEKKDLSEIWYNYFGETSEPEDFQLNLSKNYKLQYKKEKTKKLLDI
ncbi:hypothetical protein PPL_06006 [Heterostelium album PN500]|uniref:Uncharacterized protein n=1 Tax=Heterostelium pallidum (strain ATCC 26659 / Pp 5 / PN500) TaxID=670386 RepID=D3BBY6_HETP5|nr:hypothetical protein PPL_06006 [Heterostelium album PN500]EFA81169.1 hypothetical protein PPL_06006 [Heterostelium album PN500]|eukprot:XP_020433287.1 hypothetical protein PPL_06006 [Heterostelium album PN500]